MVSTLGTVWFFSHLFLEGTLYLEFVGWRCWKWGSSPCSPSPNPRRHCFFALLKSIDFAVRQPARSARSRPCSGAALGAARVLPPSSVLCPVCGDDRHLIDRTKSVKSTFSFKNDLQTFLNYSTTGSVDGDIKTRRQFGMGRKKKKQIKPWCW